MLVLNGHSPLLLMSQSNSTPNSQQRNSSSSRPFVKGAEWEGVNLRCNKHSRLIRPVVVQKEGPNKGRTFYSSTDACKSDGCRVWHWADGLPSSAPSTPARSQATPAPSQRVAPPSVAASSQATQIDSDDDEFDKMNDFIPSNYHPSPSSPSKRANTVTEDADDIQDDVFNSPSNKRPKTTFGNLSTPSIANNTTEAFKTFQQHQQRSTPTAAAVNSTPASSPAKSPTKDSLVVAFAPLEDLLSNHVESTVAAFKAQLERSDRLRVAAEKRIETKDRIVEGLKEKVKELEGQKRCAFVVGIVLLGG